MQLLDLDGDWRVKRVGGLLPPMLGVWKRIQGDHGKTQFGFLPGIPFQIGQREGCVMLVYRPPLSMIIDWLQPQPDGSWLGKSTFRGRELGQFRMIRK